jgi:integrase
MHYNIIDMTTRRTANKGREASGSRRKRPRTFSLSEDVVQVLENYKRQRKADSLTAAFEQIVRDWKQARLGEQFTAYYDSLSSEEVKEETEWGEFSESQM